MAAANGDTRIIRYTRAAALDGQPCRQIVTFRMPKRDWRSVTTAPTAAYPAMASMPAASMIRLTTDGRSVKVR